MNRIIVTAIACVGIAFIPVAQAAADPFDQANFPCQEDEYLGFSPAFGPDRVGCIHIDDLTDSRISERLGGRVGS